MVYRRRKYTRISQAWHAERLHDVATRKPQQNRGRGGQRRSSHHEKKGEN